MIQKPNIKFTDAGTTSMKNMSPNSLFFPTENQDSVYGQNKATCGSPGKWTIT